MKRKRKAEATKTLFSSLILLFIVAGCASTRYIANPSQPPPDLGLQSSADGIEARLHYIITPNGPGSWIKDAIWNEWVISVRNSSKSDITITDISLIDPRGVYVYSVYPSLAALQSASRNVLNEYKDWYANSVATEVTTNVAAQAVAKSAVKAAVDTHSNAPIYGAVYGVGYLSTVPSLVGDYRKEKDKKQIEAEFKKRTLLWPFSLSEGGAVQGSVFFPMIPQPKALVLNCVTATWARQQIKIELKKIS